MQLLLLDLVIIRLSQNYETLMFTDSSLAIKGSVIPIKSGYEKRDNKT